MDTLSLTPMPFENSAEARGYRRVRNEGFVDEAVVLAVIAQGPYERIFVKSEDMVLASNENDFAGWALPVASPFRDFLDIETPAPAAAEIKLPGTPSLDGMRKFYEPGLSEPHQGKHRWWLIGLSGALTCSILSLTLLNLVQHSGIEAPTADYTSPQRKIETVKIVSKEREVAPALVKVLSGK